MKLLKAIYPLLALIFVLTMVSCKHNNSLRLKSSSFAFKSYSGINKSLRKKSIMRTTFRRRRTARLRKATYQLLALFTALTMTNCESIDSSELDPGTPVFQDYYIIYNKTKNTTEARATFKRIDDKGVRIVLGKNSNVKFNNVKEDHFSTLFDHFYTWERHGLIDVEIVYNKDSKQSFANTFEPQYAPEINFKDDFTTLSLKSKNMLEWNGTSLKENDEIQVQITQGDNSISFLTGGKEISTLEINHLQASDFKKGKAKISLLRKHTTNTITDADKTAGGRISYATEVIKEIVII